MPIPGLTHKDPVEIEYTLNGTPEQYAKKVYGSDQPSFVSPEVLPTSHLGWDIREAYDAAWLKYSDLITHAIVDSDWIESMAYARHTDVISSVPLKRICTNGNHAFRSQRAYAIGDAPERGTFCPVRTPLNSVYCDGTEANSWYRASNIFGYRTAEWSSGFDNTLINPVEKVISTNCNCWPTVMRVGRYGTWDKAKLSHTAYQDTIDVLI
jgi:hypothetical protein